VSYAEVDVKGGNNEKEAIPALRNRRTPFGFNVRTEYDRPRVGKSDWQGKKDNLLLPAQ
jgi:hypothetical protein